MIYLIALLGTGGLALYFWHKEQQSRANVYLGAPAWPAMLPQVVPQIGLPPGLEQAPTYYGIQESLLWKYATPSTQG